MTIAQDLDNSPLLRRLSAAQNSMAVNAANAEVCPLLACADESAVDPCLKWSKVDEAKKKREADQAEVRIETLLASLLPTEGLIRRAGVLQEAKMERHLRRLQCGSTRTPAQEARERWLWQFAGQTS